MKKRYKILIICLLMLIICFISGVELLSKEANSKIEDFIKRGEYVTTIDKIEYYKVLKKYEYEETNNIINDLEDKYIGTTGDIYISAKDPLDFFLTKYLSKKLRIGHGAIVKSEDAKVTVEIVGNDKIENNIVKEVNNEWFKKKNDEITVIRVKNINLNDKEKIQNAMEDNYEKKYNYFFLTHAKNRFYCLDLCSRVYEDIGYDIDNNSIITLGTSMIKDEDTYIIYYKKRVNINNVNYRIYYLSEE